MKNLLKVAALAFVCATGLTSCESKPAETTTTEPAGTEMTTPMATDGMDTTAAPMAPAMGDSTMAQ